MTIEGNNQSSSGADAAAGAVASGDIDGANGVIVLHGEIDFSTAPQLDGEVERLLNAGVRRLVIDFEDVSFFDSACLSVLAKAKRMADERGGEVVLRNVNSYARRILDITGLTQAFEIVPTEGT